MRSNPPAIDYIYTRSSSTGQTYLLRWAARTEGKNTRAPPNIKHTLARKTSGAIDALKPGCIMIFMVSTATLY